MKTLTTTLLATAFLATPALACDWMKSAKKDQTIATVTVEKDAPDNMSTFDPATTDAFEETVTVEEKTGDTD